MGTSQTVILETNLPIPFLSQTEGLSKAPGSFSLTAETCLQATFSFPISPSDNLGEDGVKRMEERSQF